MLVLTEDYFIADALFRLNGLLALSPQLPPPILHLFHYFTTKHIQIHRNTYKYIQI